MTAINIDTLIHTKRKTIHLEVGTDARLTVRVPLECSDEIVQKFVDDRRDWIISTQKYAIEHCKQVPPKKYAVGEEFLYLGKAYKLITSELAGGMLVFNGDNFLISVNQLQNTQELFIKWYKQKALKIITERADLYSSLSDIKYRKIRITSAKHRWGSCSPDGNLNFTCSLVMAPSVVIDCVIVH
jgi:predicted metal-dependent hydrolase